MNLDAVILDPATQHTISVPVHDIPNFILGEFEHNAKICVLFPPLHVNDSDPERSQIGHKKFPSNLHAPWYERVLRPAAAAVVPTRIAEYPVTYGNIQFDRGRRCLIGADKVAAFSASLIDHATRSGIEAFRTLIFYIERRGLKSETTHNGSDEPAREAALRQFTSCITEHSLRADTWRIDVGLEVFIPGYCLQPNFARHRQVLEILCPNASPELIDGLLRSPNFRVDTNAQIYAFAGFDCTMFRNPNLGEIIDTHLYPTDKLFHFNFTAFRLKNSRTGNPFTRRTAECLLTPAGIESLLRDLGRARHALDRAAGYPTEDLPPPDAEAENTEGEAPLPEYPVHEGAWRLEVGVPLRKALEVLVDLDWESLRPNILMCHADQLWCGDPFPKVSDVGLIIRTGPGRLPGSKDCGFSFSNWQPSGPSSGPIPARSALERLESSC